MKGVPIITKKAKKKQKIFLITKYVYFNGRKYKTEKKTEKTWQQEGGRVFQQVSCF